jgi:starch phosphorylase
MIMLPESISRLEEIAYNLWWSWHPEARALFGALDHTLWKQTQHNPIQILQDINPERLKELAHDRSFLNQYHKVLAAFDTEHTDRKTWFDETFPDLKGKTIAYFSAEFGIHNSLPIYSGGLGLLAGDHCKEAGAVGVPLTGVGFLYQQGYFHQHIHADGRQEAVYKPLDINAVALKKVTFPSGETLVEVPSNQGKIYVSVYHVSVGPVSLYLLDTDVPENAPWDRELSARLYAGDQEFRIRQEIVLGIGGVRALRALGIAPDVWHLNEGHTAFMILERIREEVAKGTPYQEAAKKIRQNTVFTTHTPVPAGHDAYPASLIEKYFSNYWPLLSLSLEGFWAMGQHHETWGEAFNMTALALRFSGGHNAVSVLNGKVSRKMWQCLWPDHKEEDVPISAITNGVHIPTWVALELRQLYEKYLSPDWENRHDDPALWEKVFTIPDSLFWRKHLFLKRKLLRYIQERARTLFTEKGAEASQVLASGALLDGDTLTIGFARRFATYKRPVLLFHDLPRLKKILTNKSRPLQIIFAGKAHPSDEMGKRLLHQVYNFAFDPELAGRIAFVENYDMRLAHDLIQGVDLWLNTPRHPFEACGTSGMKAAVNGVPHLSTLDGWWIEGYNGKNGWAFGDTTAEMTPEKQDEEDSNRLYEMLEQEIIPLYYDKDKEGVPHQWIQIAKEAIRKAGHAFSARRMVKEYTEKLYVPAARQSIF